MAPKKGMTNASASSPKKSGKIGKSVKAEGGRKKKKEKDPNLPKRAKSAYLFYSIEMWPKVVAENAGKNLSAPDVAKIIGEKWAKLSEKDKMHFNKMADDDKKRYDAEMANYRRN